jgi:NAD(P)-dependent dehydrogenase (short-subunit alcohol dehydrogenase family)
VTGIVWLSNLVLPQMAERRDGVILIISSIGGFIGSDVIGFYNMSKAAEQSLARSLAYEWGGSTAVYLAARAGRFVTGQTIVVDGGRLIGVLPRD